MWQAVILEQIAKTMVSAGDIDSAKAFANDIADSDIRGWVVAGIAETVARRGDIRGAEALSDTIAEDNPRRAEAIAAIAEAREEEVRDAVVEVVVKDGDTERALVLRSYDQRERRRSAVWGMFRLRGRWPSRRRY